MPTYEQSITIRADADAIFAFASDPENMPKYQSTVTEAHDAGEAKTDGRSRIRMKGEADGHPYEGEGWIEYRDGANTMTWGSEGANDYSGKLDVSSASGGDDQSSEVTVTLNFGPRSGHEAEFESQWKEREGQIRSSLEATLASLKKQIEEGGGKIASSADSEKTVAPGR